MRPYTPHHHSRRTQSRVRRIRIVRKVGHSGKRTPQGSYDVRTRPTELSRIAVFDSGLGSFSIVRALQATGTRPDIIYFADTANFPYGSKSEKQMRGIIPDTMGMLARRFAPDAIVVASNTPTLVLGIRDGYDTGLGALVAGVRPPIAEAQRRSDTGCIGVLGTTSGVRSAGLAQMIRDHQENAGNGGSIIPVDCSELVALAESGAFVSDPDTCRKKAADVLLPVISKYDIDTVTLSSTHLSLLAPVLRSACPGVGLVDPADGVARYVIENIRRRPVSGAMRLEVYASGDREKMQRNLAMLGVQKDVGHLAHVDNNNNNHNDIDGRRLEPSKSTFE